MTGSDRDTPCSATALMFPATATDTWNQRYQEANDAGNLTWASPVRSSVFQPWRSPRDGPPKPLIWTACMSRVSKNWCSVARRRVRRRMVVRLSGLRSPVGSTGDQQPPHPWWRSERSNCRSRGSRRPWIVFLAASGLQERRFVPV